MKPILIKGVFLTGAVSVLIAQPTWAQVVQETEQPLKLTSSNSLQPTADIPRLSQYCSHKADLTPLAPIPYQGMGETISPLLQGEGLGERLTEKDCYLSEMEFPLTDAKGLMTQPRSASSNSQTVAQVPDTIVQVTGVQLNPTDSGLEVILETADRTSAQVTTSSYDQTLLIDISNARLSIPEGEEFYINTPADGITSVTVAPLYTNSVRVTVVGEATVPTAELVQSANGLVFSLTPESSTTAAQSTPTPEAPDSQPTEPTVETAPDLEPTVPTAEEPEPPELEDEEFEIVVTGEQDGYFAPDATSATRTDTPIRDIPASIQVIPQQVIEDRQVVRLTELADNVSGVLPQSGYGGLSSQGFYVRGFSLEFESFRNGFRDFGFLSPRDVANIERVEILKGPASVLYGGGFGFSGLVNTVTEKPLSEPRNEVSMTVGSYDFYRSTLDFTGPLNEDKSLLYRLNIAYENADSFRDFNENESIFIAPALTWQIGPRTRLTAEFEYQYYDYFFDRGLLPAEIFLGLPIDRFLGEPDFNRAAYDSYSFTYNFEHEFSDNWRFRQGFNLNIIEGFQRAARNANFSEPFLEADGRTLLREASKSDEEQENYALQNEIFGTFQTGSIRHNLLFGVELARYRFSYAFFDAPIGAIDIFDPDYGADPEIFVPSYSPEEYGADNLGIYVQDLIEILPNLKVLAGVRYDSNDISYRNEDKTTDSEQSESDFSPRLGIVYQPSDSTSLYFGWANSFSPQFFSRNREGKPFEPERGEQFEIGVKQEFLDGRLSATLALYELTRQNVLTTDPDDPDFSIQTGEQKSRGIELDIAGEILPGWNIIATYAHTDAFVSEDNSIPEGDHLVNAPLNSASLWTTYEIQSGSLQGLGFGLGIVYVGDREVRLPNTIELDSYVRADASIFYRRDTWRAALNFKNIFDTKYYRTQGFYMTPEAPFTVLGTLAVEF